MYIALIKINTRFAPKHRAIIAQFRQDQTAIHLWYGQHHTAIGVSNQVRPKAKWIIAAAGIEFQLPKLQYFSRNIYNGNGIQVCIACFPIAQQGNSAIRKQTKI